MNKNIIISMNMPLAIENKMGKKATLLLNENLYIVCQFPNGESYSLKDVVLKDYYPTSTFRFIMYKLRALTSFF